MADLTHGHSAYTNSHCRCDVCRSAASQWHRDWVARQREQGLCRCCTRQADGYSHCAEHRAMNAARTRRAYYASREAK